MPNRCLTAPPTPPSPCGATPLAPPSIEPVAPRSLIFLILGSAILVLCFLPKSETHPFAILFRCLKITRSKEGGSLSVLQITGRNITFPRTGGSLSSPVLAIAATIAVATTAAAAVSSQDFSFSSPSIQEPSAASASTQASPPLTNIVSREGPYSLGNQQYTVMLQYSALLQNSSRLASAANSTSTLSRLEVLDAQGKSFYQETFPFAIAQRRFTQTLSASSSLLPGAGGAALVIRFIERPAPSPDAESPLPKESWQVFGIVNGHLTSFGAVLPLGHGTDITVDGVVAAVMIKGGIEMMPMASTAEVLAFRVWTGHFYALVPVRFDWPNGKWGEGEQCYATNNGTLTERGCIMRMEAVPQPRPPDADTIYVHLFESPDGNLDNSLNVPISPEAHPEFLDMMAIVQWEAKGQRVACSFRNLWLRIHINGKEGWVQGQQAFDALGLPLAPPQ